MYMTPQQALAQYYQNQQNRQVGIPQATVQPTFAGLPATGAPGAGAPMGNATSPAMAGLYNRTNMPPQINALAQQMQANQNLQRQIGFNGAPMPVTQPVGAPMIAPPAQGAQNVSQMMQQFQAQHQPNAPQPAQPMQQRPGMASAVPQPMPGMPAGATPAQNSAMQLMGGWGGGLGTGAANSLARYYQR